LGGDAVNGVDFQTIPSTFTIPAGQLCDILTIVPIQDAIVESTKTLTLTYQPSDGSPLTTLEVHISDGALIEVTPSPANVCAGSSVTLTATGGATYNWIPTGGLTPSTGAVVQASPGDTTTYIVIGTTAAGCSSTDTVIVNVIPTNSSAADIVICGDSSYILPGDSVPQTTSGLYRRILSMPLDVTAPLQRT